MPVESQGHRWCTKKGHGSAPPRPPGGPLRWAGWRRLFPTRDGGDGIRQNSPTVVPVLLTQEPHALSCQMTKIFCLLPSLGASHSGEDYMDAKASRPLGMWANWLRTGPSRSNKLLHLEYKESLFTVSCSWGFAGLPHPLPIPPDPHSLVNLIGNIDFTWVLSLMWIYSTLLENIPKLFVHLFLQLKRSGENLMLLFPPFPPPRLTIK